MKLWAITRIFAVYVVSILLFAVLYYQFLDSFYQPYIKNEPEATREKALLGASLQKVIFQDLSTIKSDGPHGTLVKPDVVFHGVVATHLDFIAPIQIISENTGVVTARTSVGMYGFSKTEKSNDRSYYYMDVDVLLTDPLIHDRATFDQGYVASRSNGTPQDIVRRINEQNRRVVTDNVLLAYISSAKVSRNPLMHPTPAIPIAMPPDDDFRLAAAFLQGEIPNVELPIHTAWLVDRYVDNEEGVASPGLDSFERMIYLSAVTITTVGYGDIVPLTPLTRMLCAMEATLGIVLLGFMVNTLMAARRRE